MIPFRTLGLALALGLNDLAQAEPLTFAAALNLAEQHAPILVAQASREAASRASALSVDALPDPRVFVGVDNIPVSGPDRGSLDSDFMTMQKLGITQEFPNAAKRDARKKAAQALASRDNVQLQLDRLTVRRETVSAWIAQYYAEKRLSLLDELAGENRLFESVVKAQVAAGKVTAADAITPQQERLEIENRRDELHQEQAAAIARLRRWIGDSAGERLVGDPPAITLDPARLALHSKAHPNLALLDSSRRIAEAELQEAKATKRPDWGLEFSYARRGQEFGDMVSLQVSADLPLFAADRKEPQITAKRLELEQVAAEQEAAARRHRFELESELAEHAKLASQLARLRSLGLPLAQKKMALQLASYRAGTATVNALLASRSEWIDQRLKALELEGKHAVVVSRLSMFYEED